MLVSLSAHQRSTAFAALERLSSVGHDAERALLDAHRAIRGAVVVSTCNRYEAYLELDDDHASPLPATDDALTALAALTGLGYRDLRDAVDIEAGNRAASHLFRVAAGLDSVAIGEDEIAGQVRRALERSRDAGHASPALERLFQRASETSRTVKNSTRIGESGRSLARLAIEMASSRVADWRSARVVLIGTGRYAATTLAGLRAVGAEDIRVHSASGRRSFASREGLVAVGATELAGACAAADVVICCTVVDGSFVLDAPTHAAARGARTDPQIVIDFGLPRNVDPELGTLPGVSVLDLETIRIHAPIDESRVVDDARGIIDEAVARHAVAHRVHAVAPAVVALRAYVDDRLEAEIARARDRGAPEEIERSLRHFAGVLMHGLIAHGHASTAAGGGSDWADAVERVVPAPRAD